MKIKIGAWVEFYVFDDIFGKMKFEGKVKEIIIQGGIIEKYIISYNGEDKSVDAYNVII
jgi:hypothetical protein